MTNTAELLDRIRTAVIVLNSKFKIQYLNNAAENFCGASSEYFKNRPIGQLLQGEDVREADLKRCLDNYQDYTLREADLKLVATNRHVIANLAVSAIDGEQLLLEIEPLDRILLINKGHQMRDAQIANRQLIRGMAHEIKNPLGGIRGAAQLLQREQDETERLELSELIISEVERLRDLVDRLLGPNQSPEFRNINLHAVIERVLRLLQGDMAEEITVDRSYDPSLPDIYGDFDQLMQALLNIVRNAQDALIGVNSPHLTVKTRVEHQFTIGSQYHPVVAHLTIGDNGIGIPTDLQRQIFFPLVTTKTTGTGLGLAISQSIIGIHQGLITCESAPGNTSFNVYLPFALEGTGIERAA